VPCAGQPPRSRDCRTPRADSSRPPRSTRTHDNTHRDARLSRRAVLTALGLGGAALAGCRPGGTATPPASSQPATGGAVKTDPAQLGDVTLRIWDQEVRGGGKAQIEKLNAAFTQAYPTVKLERTTKSFDDLVKTVRLGLSGDNAPTSSRSTTPVVTWAVT